MGFIAKVVHNGVETLSIFVLHNETIGDKLETTLLNVWVVPMDFHHLDCENENISAIT
jgi:hypothetical protein